jgi:hypothetical protein
MLLRGCKVVEWAKGREKEGEKGGMCRDAENLYSPSY